MRDSATIEVVRSRAKEVVYDHLADVALIRQELIDGALTVY